MAQVCSDIINDDCSYVGGTEGVSDYFYYKRELLTGFVSEKGYAAVKNEIPQAMKENYVASILLCVKPYGWDKQNILDIIDKHLKMPEIKSGREM
jgi:hypothetical protein